MISKEDILREAAKVQFSSEVKFEGRREDIEALGIHTMPSTGGSLVMAITHAYPKCRTYHNSSCIEYGIVCPFNKDMRDASICCKSYVPRDIFRNTPDGYVYTCDDGHEIVMSAEEWEQLKCDLCRTNNGLPK